MWLVAGILLGGVVLAGIAGAHTGPHAHVLAALTGLLAAGWLGIMVAQGRAAPLLWTLLGCDLAVSAGVGALAWQGLAARQREPRVPSERQLVSVEGAHGVAVGELAPEGIVRVRGEDWSAVAVNGVVPAGTPVQVLWARGVRLQVWGETALPGVASGEVGQAGEGSGEVGGSGEAPRPSAARPGWSQP